AATAWRTGRRTEFVGEESAQRRGNCLHRRVAAMRSEAQPRPRQDSRQAKDAAGRTPLEGDGANPESPLEGCSGSPLARARSTTRRLAGTPQPYLAVPVLRLGVETP